MLPGVAGLIRAWRVFAHVTALPPAPASLRRRARAMAPRRAGAVLYGASRAARSGARVMRWPWRAPRVFTGRWAIAASALVLIVAAAVAGAVIRTSGAPSEPTTPQPPTPTAGPLSEADAYETALSIAFEWGLQGSPAAHIARSLTFGRYAVLAGDSYRARVGTDGLKPDDEVWVVSFLGDVRRRLNTTGEAVEYDNMTVILNAWTGEAVWIEAYFEEYQSPFRVPRWYDGTQPAPTLPPAP